ncbi:MAG TPA: LppX_LprAFG lipoprotein [Candidatus Dormibacteraeota bacterium]|nr:LppX_LprAFG lipoprotein [Candidatus Dormibacteraeota bacterium]
MRRLLVIASLLLAACGQPSGDAAKILRESGAAMAQVQTASATLKVTRGTLSVQSYALTSATMSVRMPSDSDTRYKVKDKDITFSLEVVISGGHTYLLLPFSKFVEAPPAQAAQFPNMAKLFDPTTGLPALIPAGADKKWIASEQLDGRTVDHVSTIYSPDQVRGLLAQLESSGPVTANLWIGSDRLVRKAVLDGNFGDGGKEAAVEVDISTFNTPVIISSPAP